MSKHDMIMTLAWILATGVFIAWITLIIVVLSNLVGCSDVGKDEMPAAKVEPEELVDVPEVDVEDSNPYPLLTELLTGLHKPEREPDTGLTLVKAHMSLDTIDDSEKVQDFCNSKVIPDCTKREFALICAESVLTKRTPQEIQDYFTFVRLIYESGETNRLFGEEYHRAEGAASSVTNCETDRVTYWTIVRASDRPTSSAAYLASQRSAYLASNWKVDNGVDFQDQVDIIKNLLEEL